MNDFAHEASVENYVVTVKNVRAIVEEFLDKYNRSLLGTKEAEELIKQLEQLNG
jgi:hypothetical protein